MGRLLPFSFYPWVKISKNTSCSCRVSGPPAICDPNVPFKWHSCAAPAGTGCDSVTGDPSWEAAVSATLLPRGGSVPRRQGVSQPWSCHAHCAGQAHWCRAGPEVEGAPSIKPGGLPGRSSGEVWQQALGGGLGGSVGQSLKGPLVSSLLHSWADERRFHRQGVSLPDFITHHGSPVGVSWLLVRSWCSHGCGPVQSLVGDQGIMK